jgi:signal transduction histidine kinase
MTSLPDESGTVVQVGQYCAFTFAQQVMLFTQMLVVTLAAVGTTYFAGSIMASRFLAPLEKAVQHTRQFAENCYHELLTPITVAMSSVAAALKKKDYLAGLRSVDEDLKQVYYSLQALSRNATLDHTKQLAAAVNLKQLIVQILKQQQQSIQQRELELESRLDDDVTLQADIGSTQRIFENLITNAVKYAAPSSTISIHLDKKKLHVSNAIDTNHHIDVKKLFERGYRGKNIEHISGNGFGLAIAKELAEANGWTVYAKIKETQFSVVVEF